MSEFNYSKYVNDFVKEKYDRLSIQVPKGNKAKIEAFRKEKGYSSLNAYINELIRRDMNETEQTKSNIHIDKVKGDTVNIG